MEEVRLRWPEVHEGESTDPFHAPTRARGSVDRPIVSPPITGPIYAAGNLDYSTFLLSLREPV